MRTRESSGNVRVEGVRVSGHRGVCGIAVGDGLLERKRWFEVRITPGSGPRRMAVMARGGLGLDMEEPWRQRNLAERIMIYLSVVV